MSLIPIAPFTKATASQGSQTNDFSCIIAASANETGYGAPGAAYDKRRSNREFVRSTSEDRNCYIADHEKHTETHQRKEIYVRTEERILGPRFDFTPRLNSVR